MIRRRSILRLSPPRPRPQQAPRQLPWLPLQHYLVRMPAVFRVITKHVLGLIIEDRETLDASRHYWSKRQVAHAVECRQACEALLDPDLHRAEVAMIELDTSYLEATAEKAKIAADVRAAKALDSVANRRARWQQMKAAAAENRREAKQGARDVAAACGIKLRGPGRPSEAEEVFRQVLSVMGPLTHKELLSIATVAMAPPAGRDRRRDLARRALNRALSRGTLVDLGGELDLAEPGAVEEPPRRQKERVVRPLREDGPTTALRASLAEISRQARTYLIAAAAARLPEPEDGKRDRRRDAVARALGLLLERGELVQINGVVSAPAKSPEDYI